VELKMNFLTIKDIDINNKIVFLRSDMNVPLDSLGNITDKTRIVKSIDTMKYILQNNAKLIIATHLGRPKEGIVAELDKVQRIAEEVAKLLAVDVIPVIDIIEDVPTVLKNNKIVMLQNVRCNIGEKENDSLLAKRYASICDIFVHDAFAVGHRSEASTDGIGNEVDTVVAGLLMAEELNALKSVIQQPKNPITAIIAGSKVSTKLNILQNLATKVDNLILGGGILNTFIVASGYNVGNSLYEKNLVAEAKNIIEIMKQRGNAIIIPQDVFVADSFSINAIANLKSIEDIEHNEMILDIGKKYASVLAQIIKDSATIIWNGPVGVFEFEQFSLGTQTIANAIVNSNAYTLAGGGDTIAAINKYNIYDKIDYVSTAGGALLEYLGGVELPVIKLLNRKANITL
jgi:phosphoglycerate kinase